MRRMLVGAAAALAIALAGTAWAQTPTETQTQSSDPAMTESQAAQETSSRPATASPLALVAAAGVIALSAGAGLYRRRG